MKELGGRNLTFTCSSHGVYKLSQFSVKVCWVEGGQSAFRLLQTEEVFSDYLDTFEEYSGVQKVCILFEFYS